MFNKSLIDFLLLVMENKLLVSLFILSNLFALPVFAAGENCGTPIVVNASCPVLTLTGQTSVGKTNDISVWNYNASAYSLAGEDLVYQVFVPANTSTLFVNTKGANRSGYIFSLPSCMTGAAAVSNTEPYWFPPGDHDTSLCIPLNGATSVFVFVDHNSVSALNFSISFGISRVLNVINIPDTRGNLSFATTTCSVNSFSPYAELTYNGTKSIGSMMNFGNPYQNNDYCFTLYMKNTTGVEAPQIVEFTLGTSFINVGLISKYTAGRYANGTWQCTVDDNTVKYVFHNNAKYGSGDFNGVANSCMQYNFCMRAFPNAYGPLTVSVSVQGDGQSPGFNGVEKQICVPTEITKCTGASFGWAAPASFAAFSAGFSGFAAGAVLPVDFLDLWMEKEAAQEKIHWTTASEKNLDYYMIQYSHDGGHTFRDQEQLYPSDVKSSNSINHYISSTDFKQWRASMFRIKSVDKDGQYKFSKIIYNTSSNYLMDVVVAPNPVDNFIQIKSGEAIEELKLFNLAGDCIYSSLIPVSASTNEIPLDMSLYPKGIYILTVTNLRGIKNIRVIKE